MGLCVKKNAKQFGFSVLAAMLASLAASSALAGAPDISAHGGWRAYLASQR